MNTILTDDEIDALELCSATKADVQDIEAAVLAKLAQQSDRQRVPDGYVLVPRVLLERASASIGSFVSDQGWGQADMDAMDGIDAMLAAAPEAPAQASAVDERDRKDAERYRFIRNADRSDPHLPYQALMAYACESFDEAIDDAMEEEVRAALAQKGGAA